MIKFLKQNWIKISVTIVGLVIFGLFWGCEPRVPSLLNHGAMVTSGELKIELDSIYAIAKIRQESLERQQQFRNLILKNVLIIAESGTIHPLGLLSALFAFYGVGSAVNSTKNVVKKKLTHND